MPGDPVHGWDAWADQDPSVLAAPADPTAHPSPRARHTRRLGPSAAFVEHGLESSAHRSTLPAEHTPGRDPAEPPVRRFGARGDALIRALARANRPEEVVRVIVERRVEATSLSRELDVPVGRIVRQIAEQGAVLRAGPSGARRPAANAWSRSRRRSIPRQLLAPTRAHRTAPTSVEPSAARQGVGDSRITRLAHKLMGLIHLVESDHRLAEAQQHVRMAADTDEARREAGHGAAPGGPEGADLEQDYEALRQDVLANVLRELELNRLRREDPDGHSIWW